MTSSAALASALQAMPHQNVPQSWMRADWCVISWSQPFPPPPGLLCTHSVLFPSESFILFAATCTCFDKGEPPFVSHLMNAYGTAADAVSGEMLSASEASENANSSSKIVATTEGGEVGCVKTERAAWSAGLTESEALSPPAGRQTAVVKRRAETARRVVRRNCIFVVVCIVGVREEWWSRGNEGGI